MVDALLGTNRVSYGHHFRCQHPLVAGSVLGKAPQRVLLPLSTNIPTSFTAPSAPAWTSLGRAGGGSAAGRVSAEAGEGEKAACHNLL